MLVCSQIDQNRAVSHFVLFMTFFFDVILTVNPMNEQPFYPPMMMPNYAPYPGMMVMMPPPNMYNNNKQ